MDSGRAAGAAQSKLCIFLRRGADLRCCRLGPTTQTQFTFAPLKGFPFEVSHIATSPDHTVVVTTSGDVWTFGLNRFSQLGYTLDLPAPSPFAKAGSAQEDPIQSSPRRVVGALKKEYVLGAAASRTHTAVFTADSLFTWGTNRGQLGYPAAGSPTQVLPRKVTMIDQPVVQLAATENATACLLDSGEVVVLYREQYVKIAFPLSIFPSRMLVYHPPNCDAKPSIRKLTACGNTFAALSSHGDLFTFSFEGGAAATAGPAASMSGYSTPPGGTGASTPTGSRVVPKTQRIWNVRRSFTAVTDIGVGLDGSLILSTVSGHVFTRTRKYDSSSKQSMNSSSTGGWKFTRIPNLQRVIRVAANSTGGYAALRADVPLRHIEIDGPSLSDDFSTLMPHWARVDGPEAVSAVDAAADRARRASGDASDNEDEPDAGIERDIVVSRLLVQILHSWDLTWEVHARGTDAMVQVGSLDIPAHRSLLSARSPVLAKRLTSSRSLKLDATPFAVLILLYYLYTDSFPAIWDGRVGGPLRETLDAMHGFEIDLATTKSDLRRLADGLDLPALAQALERQAKTVPSPTLATTFGDLYTLVAASSPFADVLKPDVILRLADRDVPCHSVVLRARCPFFRTVFDDDEWYVARKHGGAVALDFNHIEWDVMSLVLEHVYRDAGMSLFQRVERSTAEQYIQHTVKILAVANELLLDKLKQVCSAVLRSFGECFREVSARPPAGSDTHRFPFSQVEQCLLDSFRRRLLRGARSRTRLHVLSRLVDGDRARNRPPRRTAARPHHGADRFCARKARRQAAHRAVRRPRPGPHRSSPRVLPRDRCRATHWGRQTVSPAHRSELAAGFALAVLTRALSPARRLERRASVPGRTAERLAWSQPIAPSSA